MPKAPDHPKVPGATDICAFAGASNTRKPSPQARPGKRKREDREKHEADEDGFGMEDNDELMVYCIMDDNLNVIRPFTVVPDIQALLEELRAKHL